MNTFKVTAYDKNTDVAVVTFIVKGKTYTGVKVSGIPKDNVASVKLRMREYIEAYIAGKAVEAAAKTDIPNEVKALFNVATEF
jgi:hypothetical protein